MMNYIDIILKIRFQEFIQFSKINFFYLFKVVFFYYSDYLIGIK